MNSLLRDGGTLVACACTLLGCRERVPLDDGGRVNVTTGSTGAPEASVEASTGFADGPLPPGGECLPSAEDVEFPAQWEGFAVGARFGPSGSERVRLALPDSPHTQMDPETGQPAGWVLFGRSPLRPGPTSPDDCYLMCGGENLEGPSRWHEGFVYPIRSHTATDAGLELAINLHEPWREWCERQQPVVRTDGGHTCAAHDLICEDPNPPIETPPCCRDRLCNQLQVCVCEPDECRVAEELVRVQLSWSGPNALVGMLDDMRVGLFRPEAVDAPAPDGALPEGPGMDAGMPMNRSSSP